VLDQANVIETIGVKVLLDVGFPSLD